MYREFGDLFSGKLLIRILEYSRQDYKIPLKESEKAEGKTYKDKRHGINTAKVLITYNISA